MNYRFVLFFVAAAVAVAMWFVTCAAWQADRVMAGVRPLDPRSFEQLTLVTAGTGGAYENPRRLGPALVVGLGEDLLLLDAGRGTAEALRSAEIPLAQAHTLLLTSLLPENTLGLDDLLVTGWLAGREAPLRLAGPVGTAELAARIEAALGPALDAQAEVLSLPREAARIEVVEPAALVRLGGMALRSAELAGGPVSALAWRIEANGRSLVVAPVAWGEDALAGLADGADLLVREATVMPTPEIASEIGLEVDPERLRRELALRTALDRVGEVASRAGIDTLVLVRVRPPPVFDLQYTGVVSERFSGSVVIADDGDAITP